MCCCQSSLSANALALKFSSFKAHDTSPVALALTAASTKQADTPAPALRLSNLTSTNTARGLADTRAIHHIATMQPTQALMGGGPKVP
jgi:hypothetical protein